VVYDRSDLREMTLSHQADEQNESTRTLRPSGL